MEWDYSGRKERDGKKKKIGKANEKMKKEKVKKQKMRKWMDKGKKGVEGNTPAPSGAYRQTDKQTNKQPSKKHNLFDGSNW